MKQKRNRKVTEMRQKRNRNVTENVNKRKMCSGVRGYVRFNSHACVQ